MSLALFFTVECFGLDCFQIFDSSHGCLCYLELNATSSLLAA